MGLAISPPLPIICNPFRFLKSLNLNSVGLGLDEISFEFGWNLVVWKPFGVQFEPKAMLGPNEAGIEIVDVLDDSSPTEDDGDSDTVRAETGSEPVSEQGDFGTGPEPVPEFGEVGVEPPPIFEENMDASFDKVADFERDEEVDTPVVIVQPKTIRLPQPGEGQKRKWIKTPAGRTDLPLVRQFRAMQAKASSSPSYIHQAKTLSQIHKKVFSDSHSKHPKTIQKEWVLQTVSTCN